MNSLSPSRIHWGFINWSRIHFEFTIFFANLVCTDYFFRELTLNSLSPSRIHWGSINLSRIDPEFTIPCANSLSIHYLCSEFTINSLSLSQIQYGSINFFAYSLWIHYLFRVYTMDPLSYSPIRYTICIAIDPLLCFSQIHSLFTFFSRDHYGSFICFVNSLFISVRSMTKLLRDSWTITKTITI